MTLSAGIDLGSTTIKLVLMEDGQIIRRELENSSSNPQQAALSLLKAVPKDCPILATGYGRDLLEVEHNIPTITEIKAHAAGARFLFPDCAAVVDIGGQGQQIRDERPLRCRHGEISRGHGAAAWIHAGRVSACIRQWH